jgi:hypothetical protein
MKKLSTLFLVLILASCTPLEWDDMINTASTNATNQTLVDQTPPILPQNIQYDENGNVIPDFVPAVQPFVNEACNTAWDNLSAIVEPNGSVIYFINLPDYTADSTDYDKDRFTFIYQVKNPWFGQFPEEEPYTMLQVNWYMLPIDDYGSLTCSGLQEVRIWVYDELTNRYFMNSQVVWAAVLCNGQGDCDQGYSFDQIEYTPYQSGYTYLQAGSIVNY